MSRAQRLAPVVFMVIAFSVLWMTWGRRNGYGPRLVTITNTTGISVNYSFTENATDNAPRAEFKGVLAPGESASVRCTMLDQFVVWEEGHGRSVASVGMAIEKIRVELKGSEIVTRSFKANETAP